MRKANEDGQFEDTCQGCEDCDCEEAEVLPSFPETVVVIPEVEGNPYGGLSKYAEQVKKMEEISSKRRNVQKKIDDLMENNLNKTKAFDVQVGGDHYKDLAIQPTEFIMKNKLDFLEGCIIKRICRYKKKGFPLQDLRKAQHEIDMIIELEGY